MEVYEYFLVATAGSTRASVKIFPNGMVEGDLQWSGMGDRPFHYRWYGKNDQLSTVHGWITIQRIEDKQGNLIPIQALEVEFICEYIKLPPSRFLQHPQDMLWQAARWHEFFDLLLFPNNFLFGCLETLQSALVEGTLAEIYKEDSLPYLTTMFAEHVSNLLFGLDKLKLTRLTT